jgi:hypothetical protein
MVDRVWIATATLFVPELPFIERTEIASVPLHVDRITTELFAIGVVATVIKRSIKLVPPALIVIVFDAFDDKLGYPPKVGVAVILLAVVPPVFEKATRITNVIPPT